MPQVVRQGESRVASENELLGEFSLQGVRQAPRMEPRIDVTFKIDTNGWVQNSEGDDWSCENLTLDKTKQVARLAFGGISTPAAF